MKCCLAAKIGRTAPGLKTDRERKKSHLTVEARKMKEAAAVLTTLHKDVYEDHLENAMADGNQKEADGGVYYTYYENEKGYLTALNDAVFVRITADKENIEAVVARISLSPAN